MTQLKDPKALYDRTYQLEQELLTLKEDLKELKGEFVYHKDYNQGGLEKDVVVKTMKAAKARAKQDDIKKRIGELEELETIMEKLGK